jgi:putative PIN family toxin of toxin-antitoxin system
MRLVLDTNVVVSGLLWSGPTRLLDLIRRTNTNIMTCPELLDELSRVSGYPKFRQRILAAGINIDQLRKDFVVFAKNTSILAPVPHICRDANDEIVLACAVAANADMIVTGDKDLLIMKQYQNIPIVQVSDAFRLLRQATFRHGFP